MQFKLHRSLTGDLAHYKRTSTFMLKYINREIKGREVTLYGEKKGIIELQRYFLDLTNVFLMYF